MRDESPTLKGPPRADTEGHSNAVNTIPRPLGRVAALACFVLPLVAGCGEEGIVYRPTDMPALPSETSVSTPRPTKTSTTTPAKPPTTTTSAPPTTPKALMAMGSSGPDVVELQKRLAQIGWWSSATTGTYDATLAKAVSGFQAKRGLSPTGSVDKETWTALLNMTYAVTQQSPTKSATSTWRPRPIPTTVGPTTTSPKPTTPTTPTTPVPPPPAPARR